MPFVQQGQCAAGESANERLEKIKPQPPCSEPGDLLAPIRATDLHDHRERLDQRISNANRPPHQFRKPRNPERDPPAFIGREQSGIECREFALMRLNPRQTLPARIANFKTARGSADDPGRREATARDHAGDENTTGTSVKLQATDVAGIVASPGAC